GVICRVWPFSFRVQVRVTRSHRVLISSDRCALIYPAVSYKLLTLPTKWVVFFSVGSLSLKKKRIISDLE
ncbi:hypothetical protein, partial [Enterobacter hormaechei]|uniref:hypothetical protein n=1 Tax=Enterobacter hormaechei TaxID=158836 RepID=UPI001F393B6E